MVDEFELPQQKIFRAIHRPVIKGTQGFFTPVFGKDSIRNSLVVILLTRLGERVHLPEFGSRLWELVFEPVDAVFEHLANEYVFEAIERWEPRVEIISTAVVRGSDTNEALLVVQFRITQPVPEESSLSLALNRDLGTINLVA